LTTNEYRTETFKQCLEDARKELKEKLPQRIILYERMSELDGQIKNLEKLIRGIKKVLKIMPTEDENGVQVVVVDGRYIRGQISIIVSKAFYPMTAMDVFRNLNGNRKTSVNSVRAMLHILVKDGEIEKASRGKFQKLGTKKETK